MSKSKQKDDQAAPASPLLSIDEALSQPVDHGHGADGLGEIASEVQSFIARRNELLRRLNLEIAATEKKLAELRRTKERLFPDGSVELRSDVDRSERKPRKTTKAAKTSHASPDVQPAKVSAGSESPGSLMIHHSVVHLVADANTAPDVDQSHVVADARAFHHVQASTGEVLHAIDLDDSRRSFAPLTFHPGHPMAPRQTVVDLPAVSLPPCELSSTGPTQNHCIAHHRVESAALLFIEPELVRPEVRRTKTPARRYRIDRTLRARARRPRPTRWSRDWASPASSARGNQVGRNRTAFEYSPLFSPSLAGDGLSGLQTSPLTLRYARRPSIARNRNGKRRLYKPQLVRSQRRSLPRIARHGSFRTGLRLIRPAA